MSVTHEDLEDRLASGEVRFKTIETKLDTLITSVCDVKKEVIKPREVVEAFEAVQAEEDVRTRFADAGDCISWAGSSLAGQRAKATAMIALRDQTRQTITQIIADIKDGRRATPASFADIAGDLPALVWP